MLGELNKEKEAVEQALRIDSDHAELLHHYAKVLIKEGKANEAAVIIERLIEQDIRNEALYETYIYYQRIRTDCRALA
ncbi:tetratricopeptide repeat protein [Parageobacillus toebii]|uniref:Uncharacterized protein n=1 Tax=Parageobacillus toebii TaxID=153151 RepID=A0A150N0N1_9BACL|nr:tetratricopeptide repeat protein [Parageobacillus toebii]KYD30277.1 hypothetical protein B4110_1681 [Parageobacillus toebii]